VCLDSHRPTGNSERQAGSTFCFLVKLEFKNKKCTNVGLVKTNISLLLAHKCNESFRLSHIMGAQKSYPMLKTMRINKNNKKCEGFHFFLLSLL